MTNPDDQREAAWLADFKRRHDLDPAIADGSLAAQRAEAAAAYAAEHVPPRFALALPAVPAVDQWVADVAREAIAGSYRRGEKSPTVRGGPSLLLTGPTGVGKTHESYGAMRALNLLGIHCRWQVVCAADLYARLRPRHGIDSEQEFRSIADAPALVVDDMGAAKHSDWVEEVNLRLVNRRYDLALPSIFTSNLTPKDTRDGKPGLATVLGDRVASRLREMTRLQAAIKGQDRRGSA